MTGGRGNRRLHSTSALKLAMVCAVSALAASPGAVGSTQQTPKEFVVIGLGDSYAAGEGAPETAGSFSYNVAQRAWTGTSETWTVGGGAAARRCHRSPLSGFGQSIKRLREAFEQSGVTVTFRTFACSGAGVRFTVDPLTGALSDSPVGGGLLLNYAGVPGERDGATTVFAPQVTQARQFLENSGKTADAILMNVGGNDAGFARLIVLCAIEEYLANPSAAPTEAAACQNKSAAADIVTNLSSPTVVSYAQSIIREGTLRRCAFMSFQAALNRTCTPTLRASYDLLGQALRGVTPRTFMRCNAAQEAAAEASAPLSPVGTTRTVLGVTCTKRVATSLTNPVGRWTRVDTTYPRLGASGRAGGLSGSGRVLITNLPDPLTDETGATCDQQPSDDRATRKVRFSEADFLRTVVRPALNAEVSSAANRNSWTVVAAANALRHGICATAAERRFNTNRDALATQGEDVSSIPRLGTDSEPALSGGFVHPNVEGYRNLYTGVATSLRAQICQRFALNPCPALAPLASSLTRPESLRR